MDISATSQYTSSMYSTYTNNSYTDSSSKSSDFAQMLMSSLDSDSSGSIDVTEFSDAALALSSSETDEDSISEAFSLLDDDEDGEVSLDELTSYMASTGQAGQAGGPMGAGGPPPPPPPSSSEDDDEDTGYTQDELNALAEDSSSTDASLSALFETLSENFDEADTNEDGTVTVQEAMAYQAEVSGSEDTSGQMGMAAGTPPPPPPPSQSGEDAGYTQDELSALAEDSSSTDANLSSLFETLASNFDEADTNGDGKVTSAEAMAYKQSSDTTATSEEEGQVNLLNTVLQQMIASYSNDTSRLSSFNLSA